MREVKKAEADDYFVMLLSDANLAGYGASPAVLARALTSDPEVSAFSVFIAEEENAREMQEAMPAGRARVVMDTAEMPRLFKDLFSRIMLQNSRL